MSANRQPGKGDVGARRPIITPEVCDNDRAALTASKAAGHVPQGRPGLDHNPAKDV